MSGANTWRGANTWSVALNQNELSGGGTGVQSVSVGNTNLTLSGTAQNPVLSGTLTDLTGSVAGNNNYIAGMYAPPFGTSAIVCAGTDTFLIEDTLFTPLLAVSNTAVLLGGAGTLATVPVTAPTVTPGTTSDDQVATTAFVQSAISATPSSIATNLAGGLGGEIPYQSAVNTTAFLANGTVGQVLTSAGTTLAPTWTTPSGGGGDLSTVLIAGNSAGSTAINMNSQNITAVNNLTVASPYNFSVVSIFANATARDLALPSPYAGQMAFLTGSNKLQYWNTNWGNVSVILNNPVITGFTLTTQYELIYVNASNAVINAPTLGGFTVVRFFPTTTTSGTITIPNTTSVDYLLVAGGGGGGGGTMFASDAGGGGGGGFLTATGASMVELTSYAVTVGGGGIAGVASTNGGAGANSSLVVASGTITATGGGGGGTGVGVIGGSGGGGGYTGVVNAGGAGTALQGNAGGSSTTVSPYPYSGGGGGAGGVGSSSVGQGGVGLSSTITGATVFYAGGGGGGASAGTPAPPTNPTGGNGGGGNGGYFNNVAPTAGTNGRGGGGGGRGNTTGSAGASGGSGVVIVKFPSYS